MIELMNKAKELDIVLWNFIDKYIRLHKQGLLTTIEALDKIDSCLCIAHRDNRDIILLECHKKLLTNKSKYDIICISAVKIPRQLYCAQIAAGGRLGVRLCQM